MIRSLVMVGLVVNLIGVLKIYCSVKSADRYLPGVHDEKKGKPKPVALLDKELSQEGIRIICYGICAQLLAMLSTVIFQ